MHMSTVHCTALSVRSGAAATTKASVDATYSSLLHAFAVASRSDPSSCSRPFGSRRARRRSDEAAWVASLPVSCRGEGD